MLKDGCEPSISYLDDLIYKTFQLYRAVKTVGVLLNNPYDGHDLWRLDQQVYEQLRMTILNDLSYIVDNLNRPEILGPKMIKLSIAPRYGWSGRGIENEAFQF